jgi:hypothetical protein
MNTSKTESIAINAITNEINQYDNLQENLRKRDKEPVWDGKIELYKKDSNKTTDIVGIIPVQVKGQNIKQKNKIQLQQKTRTNKKRSLLQRKNIRHRKLQKIKHWSNLFHYRNRRIQKLTNILQSIQSKNNRTNIRRKQNKKLQNQKNKIRSFSKK